MNRYVTGWERLLNAVKRVMATGPTEAEAKSDLCRAISDRAVAIRLQPRENATTGMTARGTVLNGEDVYIPAHLSAGDIDWNNSHPLKPWAVRRERIPHLKGHWHIEWIEVSGSDVTRILCDAPGGQEQRPRSGAQRGRGKSRPALERACDAIKELYPDGVPAQAVEPNANLCRHVG
ncbi:MAG TPA: hypothetical protein VNO18_24715, partial [Xanthobacteraceae bacterium]|nr:hypothetical protein [Xanthobacteraceae bacterium]